MRHRVRSRFSRIPSRFNDPLWKCDTMSERSLSRVTPKIALQFPPYHQNRKANRPALWIKYAYVIRYATVVLGDENDDDDEVSALTRSGTMLRYGYQPAHKTALALPPYATKFIRTGGKERFSRRREDGLFLLTSWQESLEDDWKMLVIYIIYIIYFLLIKKKYIYFVNQ